METLHNPGIQQGFSHEVGGVKMMSQQKRRALFGAGCALLVLAVVIATAMISVSLQQKTDVFLAKQERTLQVLTLCEKANADLVSLQSEMKDAALAQGDKQLQSALSRVDAADAVMQAHFDALKNLQVKETLYVAMVKAYDDWTPIRNETLAYVRAGEFDEAINDIANPGAAQVSLVQDKLQAISIDEKATASATAQIARQERTNMILQLGILTLFAVLLSGLIAYYFISGKKIDEKLRQKQNELMAMTLSSIGDGLITTDAKRRITSMNKTAAHFTGYSAEEAAGKHFEEVVHLTEAESATEVENPIKKVLKFGEILKMAQHSNLTAKDGALRQIAFTASPMKNDVGHIVGVLMIVRDVSDRVKLHKEVEKSESQYRTLFERMQNGYALFTMVYDEWENPSDCRYVDVNPSYEIMTGLKKEDCIGKTMKEVLPDTRNAWIATYGKVVRTGEPIRYENYVREQGKYFENIVFKPMEGHFAIMMADVSDIKMTHKALYAAESRHSAIIENIADVIAILDEYGFIKFESPNVEKYFGYKPDKMMGADNWAFVHPEDKERVKATFKQFAAQGSVIRDYQFRMRCYDGTYKDVECTAVNLLHDEHIQGILINYHDISERKHREAEILYLNQHDALTGLYNRAHFEKMVQLLDTEKNWPLSIIMGDVNGLKFINDMFGHAEGDKLLRHMADCLMKGCDGKGGIFRTGGDEFCILLARTDNERALQVCKQIYDACDQDHVQPLYRSISLGCATKEHAEQDFEKVFAQAEDLMYKDKLLGRNKMHRAIVETMKKTMIEKHHMTEQHAQRLVQIAQKIGRTLALSEEQIKELALLAPLHDLGKLSIDDKILEKKDTLTPEEWTQVKKHPEAGYRMAKACPELTGIAEYILSHHERWDGTGYPQGLESKSIQLHARIIAIVDAYEAMTKDKPYRKAISKEDALLEIEKCAGTQFDPDIARAFVHMMRESEMA